MGREADAGSEQGAPGDSAALCECADHFGKRLKDE
jgi:hypothetical protein